MKRGISNMANQAVRKDLGNIQEMIRKQGVRKGQATIVDLIFVIDGTKSMQNALDAAKNRALTMYSDIVAGLAEYKRSVRKLRVKVIVFRDFYVDAVAYEESDYFILNGQENDDAIAFRDFIAGIRAMGGGDGPEHGLEALHHAMKLDFTPCVEGQKARHIIVMMTDADAHPLNDVQRDWEENRSVYPADMPRDLEGLQEEWESMDPSAKRLIIFAPNAYPWNILTAWNEVHHTPSQASMGISEAVFQQVISAISGSV